MFNIVVPGVHHHLDASPRQQVHCANTEEVQEEPHSGRSVAVVLEHTPQAHVPIEVPRQQILRSLQLRAVRMACNLPINVSRNDTALDQQLQQAVC